MSSCQNIPSEVHIRRWIEVDTPRIVAIYSAMETDSTPLTVERYLELQHPASPHGASETWVAVHHDTVIGFGGFSPAWWTGDPSVFSMHLLVDPLHQRRGIGTRLLDTLRSRLTEHGARSVLCWVRRDAEGGLAFASHHGFDRTGQEVEEYRLHVPEASVAAYSDVEGRLQRGGITITSLADIDMEPTFLQQLRRLWEEGDATPTPGSDEASLDVWRRQVLQSPGSSPETHWVALDGGRPVGTTFLGLLSPNAAENDYTAVAPSYRGRGIAPALKLHAIAWAQQHGIEWFYTSSEVGNSPMLTINRRLGYRPGAHRVELTRRLP